MTITLETRIDLKRRAETQEERYTVRQLKTALNRLGWYTPDAKTGMNDDIDDGLRDAVYAFQRKATIFFDDVDISPGSTTERILNRDLAAVDDHTFYIWRTVGDGKVRGEHAVRNGQTFSWSNPPGDENPGEDYNCRCWAELVSPPYHPWIEWVNKKREERLAQPMAREQLAPPRGLNTEPLVKEEDVVSAGLTKEEQDALIYVRGKLTEFKREDFKVASFLLEHYLGNTGKTITLSPNAFSDSVQLKKALETNRQRFLERSFFSKETGELKDSIKNLENGETVLIKDYWDDDIKKTDFLGYYLYGDTDFYLALGSVKMRSTGEFSIKRNEDIFYVAGSVVHSMDDMYDFNEGFPDGKAFEDERLLAQSGLAKPFKVHWEMKQNVKGIIIKRKAHLYWNSGEK